MKAIRLFVFAISLVAGLATAAPAAMLALETPGPLCPVTETIREEPPPHPRSAPFGRGPWYVNAERTLWADPWHPWETGRRIKVLWIKPAGEGLNVSGRRLDGEVGPLKARIPCCYPWTFQSTGLTFPSPGCWEVTGTAGSQSLRFVVSVAPPSQGRGRNARVRP